MMITGLWRVILLLAAAAPWLLAPLYSYQPQCILGYLLLVSVDDGSGVANQPVVVDDFVVVDDDFVDIDNDVAVVVSA